uniref:UPAR/Ly6 domain-containing protein n=1 Tax=Neolamprologus brichardi TaxID=32507 RepID=A0A3Q4HQ83_NEOBR
MINVEFIIRYGITTWFGNISVNVLFVSIVCGLRCYTCTAADPKSCIDSKSCAVIFNRCFSLRVDGESALCVWPMSCCEAELCNSAIPTGPSAILLLVSSAILKFLF